MLFDLSNNSPFDIPKWAEEELMSQFPYFFKDQRPVVLRVLDQYKHKSYKVPSGNPDSEPRLFVQAPGASSIKSKGNFYDKELQRERTILYTTSAPSVINGNVNYQHTRVEIADGFVIEPHQKDLLFYIHFICPIIEGNESTTKSYSVRYEYERKDVEAKVTISAARAARDLENLIYFDANYSTIVKVVEGLGLSVLHTEDETRVMLHDAIKKGSDVFRKNAFEIFDSLKSSKPVVMSDSDEKETIHEFVNRILSEKLIKREDKLWYIRDRRGDGTKWLTKPFFESQSNDNAAVFELIDHLKVNEELLNKLRKL